MARGIQFLLPSPRPPFQPPGPRTCRAQESTVSPILMYLLPVEVARFAFHSAGPGPPFISHYETSSSLGGNPLRPRPADPLVPLRLGHCTRFHRARNGYRSGVRSSEWGRSFRFSATPIAQVSACPGERGLGRGNCDAAVNDSFCFRVIWNVAESVTVPMTMDISMDNLN